MARYFSQSEDLDTCPPLSAVKAVFQGERSIVVCQALGVQTASTAIFASDPSMYGYSYMGHISYDVS